MSDETNIPGEKPKDDGGNAPEPEPELEADALPRMPEKPKDDGGGGA